MTNPRASRASITATAGGIDSHTAVSHAVRSGVVSRRSPASRMSASSRRTRWIRRPCWVPTRWGGRRIARTWSVGPAACATPCRYAADGPASTAAPSGSRASVARQASAWSRPSRASAYTSWRTRTSARPRSWLPVSSPRETAVAAAEDLPLAASPGDAARLWRHDSSVPAAPRPVDSPVDNVRLWIRPGPVDNRPGPADGAKLPAPPKACATAAAAAVTCGPTSSTSSAPSATTPDARLEPLHAEHRRRHPVRPGLQLPAAWHTGVRAPATRPARIARPAAPRSSGCRDPVRYATWNAVHDGLDDGERHRLRHPRRPSGARWRRPPRPAGAAPAARPRRAAAGPAGPGAARRRRGAAGRRRRGGPCRARSARRPAGRPPPGPTPSRSAASVTVSPPGASATRCSRRRPRSSVCAVSPDRPHAPRTQRKSRRRIPLYGDAAPL